MDYGMYLLLIAAGLERFSWVSLLKHIERSYPDIWHQAYSYNRQPGTPVRSDYIRAMLKDGELANSNDPKLVQYRQRRYLTFAIMVLTVLLWLAA
ncbi:hypothetical protein KJI95_11190 [Shewanella sp. JM162201]|uniref:Uncharacterized protein n=1 Tax=Shewanella jiangmenensis TaxID=2837387 RepID=A0ABS5V5W2_9GAMM|nr:hypothetical protein [Shewanella jiangmenensis]MBT1445084.1 hypothetical protein [Shewanella jiangmenensis]